MYSPTVGLNTDQPSRRCFCNEWDLYWVSTRIRLNLECKQLLRVKSMMRYFPPKGTAGLARWAVKGCSLDPIPPAKMSASTRSLKSLMFLARPCNQVESEWGRRQGHAMEKVRADHRILLSRTRQIMGLPRLEGNRDCQADGLKVSIRLPIVPALPLLRLELLTQLGRAGMVIKARLW